MNIGLKTYFFPIMVNSRRNVKRSPLKIVSFVSEYRNHLKKIIYIYVYLHNSKLGFLLNLNKFQFDKEKLT